MLSNILNLEGVAVLNKIQQERIQGGQSCTFTLQMPGGGEYSSELQGFDEGSAGSDQASSICSDLSAQTGARCMYNCESN